MSNVIDFPDSDERLNRRLLDPKVKKLLEGTWSRMDREQVRRQAMVDAGLIDKRWLDVLLLFKLTAVGRARQCFDCGQRIEPGEIHFVREQLVVCQRPKCTKVEA